jgi:hypothetical protein
VPSTQSNKASAKIFLWLFIGIGAVVICFGMNLAFQSIRCGSWPTTEGIIRTSSMGRHRGNKGGTTYSADVSYDYSVWGSRYTGTKVAFGMMSASSSYARGVLDHYPVGAKVPVHYSPSDPETAVLETGIHGGTWICFGVGSVFALFGIMFLQLMKRANADQASLEADTRQIKVDRPPKLMGIIAILFGIMATFMGRSDRKASIGYAIGAMFCMVGLYVITYRPGQNRLARFFGAAISLFMLGIFHWVAFGGLGRVEPVFAVIVSLIDLIISVVAFRWFFKRIKVKARGLWQ